MDVTVIPEKPVQGDIVTILLKADPYEKIAVKISFSKTIEVSEGRYEFRLEQVEIPSPPNSFTVKAVNVKNLKVSVNIIFWITKTAEADNGTVTVSQSNVPRGRYDIKIYGDALDGASTAVLEVTASTTVTTDENGIYEYKYDTSSIPPGEFKASIDGIIKTITLSESSPPPKPKPKPEKIPPTITNPKPTGTVNTTTPTISASYSDDAGIDVESVRLTLDGVDVTENASVTAESVAYSPQPLANATAHLAELAVADTSANEATLRWNFTVILPPPKPQPSKTAEFNLSNLKVTPIEVEVGNEFNVSILVSNVGCKQGNFTIVLRILNGLLTLEDESNVVLEAGESETVIFTVIVDAEGTYNVEVDGLTAVFNAVSLPPPSTSPLWIWGLFALVILAAAILYFRRVGVGH